jgi:3D (Asp-Asp-Asp) domain-containing protein
MSEPLTDPDDGKEPSTFAPPSASAGKPAPRSDRYRTRVIGGARETPEIRRERIAESKLAGRVLGTFRNTYYDFPSETEFDGDAAVLFDAHCDPIAKVPRGFHDAVCVQGSGLLARGQTVSFSRRDCECADICPRSGHRICFDALDTSRFPWGRGALGKAITPLLTIAVDSDVIPMETPVYIPEYDGLPTDPSGDTAHDGCFVAQDRGSRVVGKHVDVFTGHSGTTRLWNQLVPSNDGVTVVVDSPRCARLGAP